MFRLKAENLLATKLCFIGHHVTIVCKYAAYDAVIFFFPSRLQQKHLLGTALFFYTLKQFADCLAIHYTGMFKVAYSGHNNLSCNQSLTHKFCHEEQNNRDTRKNM